MKVFNKNLAFLILANILLNTQTSVAIAVPENLQLFILQQGVKLKLFLDAVSNNTELKESKCLSDFSRFVSAVPKGEMWALSMIDAFAKPQASILTGNIMHIGAYDECLAVEDLTSDIHGKYCTVPFTVQNDVTRMVKKAENGMFDVQSENVPRTEGMMLENHINSLKTSFGICIPASCNSKQLLTIWNNVQTTYEVNGTAVDFIFNDDYCIDKDSNPLTSEAKIAIYVLLTICAIMISSTAYDILSFRKRLRSGPNIIVAFSLYTNIKRLFSQNTGEDNLSCLNGLRVISMLYILFIHRILISVFLPFVNATDILKSRQKYYTMPLFAAHFAVDTFFTISGTLLVYVFLSKRDKTGKGTSWIYFYFHRILRLTPSLVAVILVNSTLIKYFGDGPFWPIVYEMFQKPCESSWWVTLLYLQNYVDTSNQCVGPAWYLAVDMQLYILSPFLLILLMKWPKVAVTILSAATIIGAALNFGINFVYDISAAFFDQGSDYHTYLYTPTHARFGPWTIGILLGYLLFTTKNKKIKINPLIVTFLWLITFTLMITIIAANHHFLNAPHDIVEASFYNGLNRHAWALSLCWIIFACVHGYGGMINRILSLQIFNVAIRINYAMYLVHFPILIALILRARTSGYLDIVYICHAFYGDLFVTFIISVIWTLTFESPVLVLEKMLLIRLSNRQVKRQSQDTTVSIQVEYKQNNKVQ